MLEENDDELQPIRARPTIGAPDGFKSSRRHYSIEPYYFFADKRGECCVCMEEKIVLSCCDSLKHFACRSCLDQLRDFPCPMCRGKLVITAIREKRTCWMICTEMDFAVVSNRVTQFPTCIKCNSSCGYIYLDFDLSQGPYCNKCLI